MIDHPIRFLLYLEWASLFMLALSETMTVPVAQLPRLPLLNLGCLIVFGMMGLRLSRSKPLVKIIYTIIEIVLISIATWVGYIRMPSLLYIILQVRNSTIFQKRTSWIVNSLVFVLLLMVVRHRVTLFQILKPNFLEELGFVLFNLVLLFGLHLVLLQLLVNSVLSDRALKSELAIANARLREYALRIEEIATLQERNRIAREIHDSLGHYLTVLNMNIEVAWKLIKFNPQEAEAFLADAKQMGSQALQEVRQSVSTLRSEPLQNQSLEVAIANLAQDFQKSTGILPKTNISILQPPADELKTAIYRITQEALTNICKYAEATTVKIDIQTDRSLHLIIQDNGKGFKISQNTTGFGLQGMRERTVALGGNFDIVTAPGKGCKIITEFPLTKLNS